MAVATKTKQLVVITPNEVGTLERICAAVREAGGTLAHICGSTYGDDARFMLGVTQIGQVRAALEALEYDVSETEAVTIELSTLGVLPRIAFEPAEVNECGVDID